MLARGLVRGLAESLRQPLANSLVIHAQASLLFLLLGASRLSALTLNFAYLAVFEIAFAWTLSWLTRRGSTVFASERTAADERARPPGSGSRQGGACRLHPESP
jgi:hypothetical protein